MKRTIVFTATLVAVLSLVGCNCHKATSSQYVGAQPMNDTAGYQSGSSSKLNGKLGHHKSCKRKHS